MKKYCLCITEERDVCTPKLFDTYEEAYAEMKALLITNIIDTDHAEEYLDEQREELVNQEEANDNGLFRIMENVMWSSLDDDYALDAKIFKFADGAFSDNIMA